MLAEEDLWTKHARLEITDLLRVLHLEMDTGDDNNIASQKGGSAMISVTNEVPILVLDNLEVAGIFRENKWELGHTHRRDVWMEGQSSW